MRYREFAESNKDNNSELVQTQQTAAVRPSLLQRLFGVKSDTAEQRWLTQLPIGPLLGDGSPAAVFCTRV
jgi:hypothetical protein